ncbi:hypothetical protein SARC_07331 [Sphaeroforma arctica JP610]|uniref:Uncharacterized protein n=1 Tax=Sphaeroforma arctica JP610 TaxID=667725 RepID=A0A0L0FWI6_9EUKA|nr:hypothetical protein SARC_07331 [Sphaeroforma arctica JP610]KNC80318.1 hypothetical protein SARC_07331 [Sphaeroforma arctica JP610]|eukprot:XP_014154220.1 hypothetical protein SARC_07331 [Sphaeroforma arctica JP610]
MAGLLICRDIFWPGDERRKEWGTWYPKVRILYIDYMKIVESFARYVQSAISTSLTLNLVHRFYYMDTRATANRFIELNSTQCPGDVHHNWALHGVDMNGNAD